MPRSPEEESKGEGFKMPGWSVRADPLNWLLAGRLGFELEVGLTKWMTAELVPVFVVNGTPPLMNLHGDVPSEVRQESNGLGALAGTSVGLGFWLGGEAFHGYVLRAIFTNYGYNYRAFDASGAEVDSLTHTDRVLMGMLGSHSMFGPFTIATGLGLGADLNKENRCVDGTASTIKVSSGGCHGLEVALGRDPRSAGRVDVSSGFYPVVLSFRLSLGVTFD